MLPSPSVRQYKCLTFNVVTLTKMSRTIDKKKKKKSDTSSGDRLRSELVKEEGTDTLTPRL